MWFYLYSKWILLPFDLMNKVYSKKGWELINDKLPIWFISGEEDPLYGK